MEVMVMEVYEAQLAAGAPEPKARVAAESIPVGESLATKQDIARLKIRIAASEAKMWWLAITVAGFAVHLNKFLDWSIR